MTTGTFWGRYRGAIVLIPKPAGGDACGPSSMFRFGPIVISMPKQKEFETTFAKLKEILQKFESKLVVVANTSTYYALETTHVMKNKKRVYFAGVKIGKGYVSYHLMPVYACAEVREKISPELKKRMQGKSCFNFSAPDEELFRQLAKLTKVGFKRFTSKDFYSQF